MWDDLCDWYLEIAKSRINAGEEAPKAILAHCLDIFLRLLHPVTPFITEAIWDRLNEVAPHRCGGQEAEPLLARAQWPRADAEAINTVAEENFALLQDLVRQIRDARSKHGVPPRQEIDAVAEDRGALAEVIKENVDMLKSQAQLGEIRLGPVCDPPTGAATTSTGGTAVHLLDVIDSDAESDRLGKQAETLQKGIRGIEAKLANEGFRTKAPAEVIEREEQRLAKLKADLDAVSRAMEALARGGGASAGPQE